MKIVSACLAGVNCKYNKSNCLIQEIKDLVDRNEAVAICPEVLGGLITPRKPAEIIRGKVITLDGEDVTDQYNLGAKKALAICQRYEVEQIILKSRSPSCGQGVIYDGNFNHTLIPGNGITTELLLKEGYSVIDEEEFSKK